MAAEYVFLDEWDVDAPQERVFDALVDARTYPEWWTPVYREVDSDGPPAVGCSSRQKFKANLPYTLSTVSTIVRMERPDAFEVDAEGDLRGHGVWTLAPHDGKVHVRFDWQVFRWNHNVAIRAAMEGLEPYARRPA